MSYAAAVAAIYDRFEVQRVALSAQDWTSMPWTDPNGAADFQRQQTDAWILLEVLSADASTSLFGSSGKRIGENRGVIYAHVFVKAQTGRAGLIRALTAAEQIGEIYRVAKFGGVLCEGPVPDGGGKGDDAGRWFRAGVSVPWAIFYNI